MIVGDLELPAVGGVAGPFADHHDARTYIQRKRLADDRYESGARSFRPKLGNGKARLGVLVGDPLDSAAELLRGTFRQGRL